MSGRISLTFPNRLSALAHVQDEAARWLAAHGASDEAAYAVRLSIEELGSNVIRYAYRDDEPHEIAVSLDHDQGDVVLTLEDDGQPFDPNSRVDHPTPSSLQEAPTGGMGLTLVKNIAGPIEYERVGGRNRTRVRVSA